MDTKENQIKSLLKSLQSSGPWALTEYEIGIEILPSIESVFAPIPIITPRFSVTGIQAQVDLSSFPQVSVKIDAASLKVISECIPVADREKILKTVGDRILMASEFPVIKFSSTRSLLRSSPDGSVEIPGILSMRGCQKELNVVLNLVGNRLNGHLSLLQSDFNIEPLTAMMGTLKCKNEIHLFFSISLEKQLNVSSG